VRTRNRAEIKNLKLPPPTNITSLLKLNFYIVRPPSSSASTRCNQTNFSNG